MRAGRGSERIARRADRSLRDPALRLAVVAAALPHRVRLRADGFDLSGLAVAARAHTFQGLYSLLRSIPVYPAGTAADNAGYVGVADWTYAQLSKWVTRFDALDGLRLHRGPGRFS